MKLIHLSDLHIGKRVNDISMVEDQKYILEKILGIIDSENPDAVIIAGDIYDKSVPSAEAVALADNFIVDLAKRKLQVYIISGNHDSPERLAFGGRIMDFTGIHFSPVYNGKVRPFELQDEYGTMKIWMLPFIKPMAVRHFFEDKEIVTYTDAAAAAVEAMNINPEERNILAAHQFVTGASVTDSEERSVGGLDNVDSWVFENFDYVALGHLHRPQDVIENKIRYCGSPLKYSFSESRDEKSVTVVEMREKGNVEVRTVPLIPLHDMVEVKGTYDEIMSKDFYDGEGSTLRNDYVHITLTDENDIMQAAANIRTVYKGFMKLDYDNARTRHSADITVTENQENKSPLQLFGEFYEQQNQVEMTDEQSKFVKGLIEKIWEGEE